MKRWWLALGALISITLSIASMSMKFVPKRRYTTQSTAGSCSPSISTKGDIVILCQDHWNIPSKDITNGPGDNNDLVGKITREKIASLGESIKSLPEGQFIIIAPKEMMIDDDQKVEVQVGDNVSFDQLAASISTSLHAKRGTLRISAEMIATLDGAGFVTHPLTTDRQAIAEGLPTVWSWDVVAKQEGERELTATLYALVTTNNSEVRQRIDSSTQKIHVFVRAKTWGEWIESLSHGVDTIKALGVTLTGAITAIIGWFGVSFQRNRNASKRAQHKHSAKKDSD